MQICRAVNPECQYISAAHIAAGCEQLARKQSQIIKKEHAHNLFLNYSKGIRLS